MLQVFLVTFRGVFRDRVFQGILLTACAFLGIPSISILSMRQVTELSITLSLSLISFILLLLAVFLGGSSLWKDIERRYIFSVVGLPVSRGEYLVGKFAGIAGFLLLTTLFLGCIALAVIFFVSGGHPPERPLVWNNLILAVLFDFLKYTLLIAFAFLFSTVSTSFFLPVFGTISIFLVGTTSQQVYDFLQTPTGATLPLYVKKGATALYYLLPNFQAFDLKLNAVYGLQLSTQGLLLTAGYFVVYCSILLALASLVFSRRELQ